MYYTGYELEAMRISLKLFAISLSVILFAGCPETTSFGEPIDKETYEWINYFENFQEGDSIQFTNEGLLLIKNIVESTPSRLADCTVNGRTEQCQYEILTLEFHSPHDSIPYYLTFYLFPKKKVVINYSDISALSPEILRLDIDTDTVEIPQPESFNVIYLRDYQHQSEQREALLSNTITTQNLFASLPPNSFILVKNGGVVEWTDYRGNVFEIQE